jgi:hypothetical protein
MAKRSVSKTQGPSLPNIRRRMRQRSKQMRALQAEFDALAATISSPSRAEYEEMVQTADLLTLESLYISACALAAFHLEIIANILEDSALTPHALKNPASTLSRSPDLLRILRHYVPRAAGVGARLIS